MPVVASQNRVELALSIVSSTAVSDAKDLCNLLAVSKGLQAAIVSKGGTGTGTPNFTVDNTNLACTCSFACWLQKYHMLVKQLSISKCLRAQDADDHANALLLGLRPPLQLTSLSIRHPRPLKLLQQLDARQLIALEVQSILNSTSSAVQALATELGRFSKLQELNISLLPASTAAELSLGSNLAQLTDLRRLTLEDCYASADWQHIPSLLQFLHCWELNDAALSNLHHLVQLKELILHQPHVTGPAWTAAAKCMPQLQALKIWWPERNSQQLQALQAMSSLQRLELEELYDLTLGDIADIAQASGLTSLKLEFGDVYDPDPMELDLSGLTTLQQLHQLDVGHCYVGSATVSVATFGHTLTHLPLLRALTVSVALHDLALAQVLSCAQLTVLKLDCTAYTVIGGLPDPDPNDAMYHVLGCFQLSAIALHMTQLQLLRIWACPQDKLVAILNGPWLPHLKQLELYTHQKHAPLEPEEVEALLAAIRQARPALQASFIR